MALVVLGLVLGGCSSEAERMGHEEGLAGPGAVATVEEGDGSGPEDDAAAVDCGSTAEADFPEVVDVELEVVGDREYRISATMCSAYDTPKRYADGWRVRTSDGEVLGVRELLHDHAGEQPFTRSLNEPITVPEDVTTVVVEGRDLVNGWGGGTQDVPLPDQ